jgi:hypothetical protein
MGFSSISFVWNATVPVENQRPLFPEEKGHPDRYEEKKSQARDPRGGVPF